MHKVLRGRGLPLTWGGVLPKILNGILEVIPESGEKIVLDFGEWEPDDNRILLSRAINPPTKEEIIAAYNKDIPVFVKVDLGASGGEVYQRVTLTDFNITQLFFNDTQGSSVYYVDLT